MEEKTDIKKNKEEKEIISETKKEEDNIKKGDSKEKQKTKPKKTSAIVNSFDLPISTKDSIAICRFIKGKKITDVVADLKQVIAYKKAIPMKGEIPHRKGNIMSGRYPRKSVIYMINVLKTLSANANVNGIEEPVISEAIANMASRPYGKFGRVRKKRTHIKIIVKEKK